MKCTSKLIYILFTLPILFTSCGGDDDSNSPSTEVANANANGTDKSQYETRIEVPHVKSGNNYLFLAKTSQDMPDGVNYIVEWDCMSHAQRWTCWMWDKSNSTKGWNRNNWDNGETFNGYGGKSDPFQPDPAFETEQLKDYLEYRTTLNDYYNSGYNRGHMCASEDRIVSKEVNGQTFYLTNMHPQISAHNTGIWSTMETRVRNWRDAIVNAGGTVYICKGGTINDVTINGKTSTGVMATMGDKKIPVPKYFYMAILKKTASGIYSAVALWTEHKNYQASEYSSLSNFMISIDELESRTGIDFFCNLPDNIENATESTLTTSEWK